MLHETVGNSMGDYKSGEQSHGVWGSHVRTRASKQFSPKSIDLCFVRLVLTAPHPRIDHLHRIHLSIVNLRNMSEKVVAVSDLDSTQQVESAMPRKNSQGDIKAAPLEYAAPKAKTEQLEDARGWESENLIHDLEKELEQSGYKKGFFDLEFKNPKHFTWILVAFTSMGGLLSGLDQSLISGANLKLPYDLGLDDRQNSLVNAGMPLGGKFRTILDQNFD
jgi:hypothetical protein